jgi:predicted RNase H-like HicB family nuclease
MPYAAIIQKHPPDTFLGYFPDVPGCFVVTHSFATTQKALDLALKLHLQSLDAAGKVQPESSCSLQFIDC